MRSQPPQRASQAVEYVGMSGEPDLKDSLARDPVDVFPREVWELCITEACHGDHYMESILCLTMVSRRWYQMLITTPTLWANVHVNPSAGDSQATIALFLYLSHNARLSLRVWVPLPGEWDAICDMLLPHKDRICKITIQTDSGSHLPECHLKNATDDAEMGDNLAYIIGQLELLTSIEHLDILSDHPVRMQLPGAPPNLRSTGSWLVPSSFLENVPESFFRVRILTISAIELTSIAAHSSKLQHLRFISLHSDEQDYIQSPPPPPVNGIAPFLLPHLTNLQYHGRFYWAPQQLFAGARTLRCLKLQIGILDFNVAMYALEAIKGLRHFTLTLMLLDYDLYAGNRRWHSLPRITNLTSKMKPPQWRLKDLESFRCQLKSFGGKEIPRNLDLDHLWRYLLITFPNLRVLVWNLPIQSATLFSSLVRQKQLRHFESDAAPPTSSIQPTGFVLSALESLVVVDAWIFSGMLINNLLHFSTTCSEAFKPPKGFTFARLRSLSLVITESVAKPIEINGSDFPVLTELSIEFLGSRSSFKSPNLASLAEITISTHSPTFTQGMQFCASLICAPESCPRLEQINLDSLLEWDILFMLLKRRNFAQDLSVSRIKRLNLPHVPPRYLPILGSLLAGRQTPPGSAFSTLMELSSIRRAESRLLDQHIIGCFCCVQLGLSGCQEPLQGSQLPKAYLATNLGNPIFSDAVESLQLFPSFNWELAGWRHLSLSHDEIIWFESYSKRTLEWKTAAYEWLKHHYRTLMCHKQLCSPRVMVTEYDTEGGESVADVWTVLQSNSEQSTALPGSVKHKKVREAIGLAIPIVFEMLEDPDSTVRAAAVRALPGLAERTEFRHAIRLAIPPMFEMLNDADLDLRSVTAATLSKLAEYEEFRDAIRPAIPQMLNMLNDAHSTVRHAAASVLPQLAAHAGFRDEISLSIASIIEVLKDMHSTVRSATLSTIAELAEHAGLRDTIRLAIPPIVEMLKDPRWKVRLDALESFSRLAEHAELRDAIRLEIPLVVEMLKDARWDVRLGAIRILPRLAEHDFREAVCQAIPLLITMLHGVDLDMRSAAVTTISRLAGHVEFRNEVRLAILPIVEMLKDTVWSVRSDAVICLSKLAGRELWDASRSAIPQMVNMLKDTHSAVRDAAASALSQLAEYAELRDVIRLEIPLMVGMLKDTELDRRSATITTLSRLAEHEDLRDEIRLVIPPIVEMLKDERRDVRLDALRLLPKIAKNAELRDAGSWAIPQMIDTLKDAQLSVRQAVASIFPQLAENARRDAIYSRIPPIIEMVKDEHTNVRFEILCLFPKFAEHAEFRDEIQRAIPLIIQMLRDAYLDVQSAAVAALSRLAEHMGLRASIREIILPIVEMLEDANSTVRSAVVIALPKLAEHGDLWEAIRWVIPSIVQKLQDERRNVRLDALTVLAKLADHMRLRDAIRPAVLLIVEMLKDAHIDVRSAAVTALPQMLSTAQFRYL